MPLKILASADIHIGRRPSKVADREDQGRFSCARMWSAIVDRAIREQVDLVALAGDVVDHENRFFEATGPLERGLVRLAEYQIPTYAIAGNHDHDVFPRVAANIGSEYFHLLGRGGTWEAVTFAGRDGQVLRIDGWSFPGSHARTSPLTSYHPSPAGAVPVLGLLHADVGVPDSHYAPVRRAELEGTDAAIWVVGHVHRPEYRPPEVGPAFLCPGSPQGMDPGEIGPHGPWLVEIHGPRNVTATLLDMAKVRYDQLPIELSGVATRDQFEDRVADQVGAHLRSLAERDSPLEFVSLRLELAGRTAVCGRIADWVARLCEEFEPSAGDLRGRIEKVINNTRPDIDLEALAQRRDTAGVLANTLWRLEAGGHEEDLNRLVQEAHQKMLGVYRARTYDRIRGDTPPDAAAARHALLRQGMVLLDVLRAQEREP